MGFNSWTTHMLLAASSERRFDPGFRFGLAGRQTVFLSPEELSILANSYTTSGARIELLGSAIDRDTSTLRSQGSISDTTYLHALLGMAPESLDASGYEGAETLLDLNSSFVTQGADDLLGSLDGVYDGGSLDNVWSPSQALMNLCSLLRPGGRILNQVCASGWPGAFCMVSCEWLFSFYAINRFSNIRVYWFHPELDNGNWPNPSVSVWRYSPWFTRRADYDPLVAARARNSHPGFVLALAECTESKAPDEWLVPMQSHYLRPEDPDWRMEFRAEADLPFVLKPEGATDSPGHEPPFGSDHYRYVGELSAI